MKKVVSMLVVLLIAVLAVAALDFTSVDDTYVKDIDDQKVYDTLKGMLSQAKTNEEKAEVLWRLSRVCVDLGDQLDDGEKKAKMTIYEEGQDYADQSLAANPSAMAHLWKCCNIGRWGQTKGITASLSKIGDMDDNLKKVFDTYNCLDSSEAWYTIAVLYSSVPGRSNEKAISYARAACDTIPSNVIYGGTYKALAEMLYKRNWSAKKRATEIAKLQTKWENETKSNTEKYAYYEGANGADAMPIWTKTKLSAMSDRQEALVILKYAQAVYNVTKYHTKSDDDNYEEIQDLIAQWSK